MFQNMNDLQTVAFKSSAYDPVAYWYGSKEELKEVELQKKPGYREQDFVEAALRLHQSEDAETKDAEQDGQQQGNAGPACKHDKLFLIRIWFFLRDEITTYRDQVEAEF
jgi:hypothetical protein